MHPVMMLMVAWQNIEGELSTSQFWEKIFRTIISQSRILELCVQAWGHIFLHQIEEGGIHVVSRRCQFRGLHKLDSICLCWRNNSLLIHYFDEDEFLRSLLKVFVEGKTSVCRYKSQAYQRHLWAYASFGRQAHAALRLRHARVRLPSKKFLK